MPAAARLAQESLQAGSHFAFEDSLTILRNENQVIAEAVLRIAEAVLRIAEAVLRIAEAVLRGESIGVRPAPILVQSLCGSAFWLGNCLFVGSCHEV